MDLKSLLAGPLFGAISSVLAVSALGSDGHEIRSSASTQLDADLWDELEDLRSEVRQKAVTRISAQAQPRALSELAEQVELMQEQLLDLQERNDGLEDLLSKVGTTVGVGTGGNRVDVDLRSLVLEDWELAALRRLSGAEDVRVKALGFVSQADNPELTVEPRVLGGVVIDALGDDGQVKTLVYDSVQIGRGVGPAQGEAGSTAHQRWPSLVRPKGK